MQTSKGGELNAEINVTPLVDVMLVLLIVFMVTAPMLQTGLDLDLPQAQAQVLEDEEGKLVLHIDKKGELYMGTSEKKLTLAEVKQQLAGAPELFIGADKNLPYGTVLEVMGMAKQEGVAKVLLLTDPLTEKPEEPIR